MFVGFGLPPAVEILSKMRMKCSTVDGLHLIKVYQSKRYFNESQVTLILQYIFRFQIYQEKKRDVVQMHVTILVDVLFLALDSHCIVLLYTAKFHTIHYYKGMPNNMADTHDMVLVPSF